LKIVRSLRCLLEFCLICSVCREIANFCLAYFITQYAAEQSIAHGQERIQKC